MIETARSALAELSLSDHEVLMVAHRDEVHPHIHCIINRVNPNTGLVNTLPYAKLKLSRWAEAYEKTHGKVYCEQRVENNARRDQGEWVKYREPELEMRALITQLYKNSDSAKAFQAAVEEQGYRLAQGRRLVLIDPAGELHSLLRQIEDAKPKDVRKFLSGLELPDAEGARMQKADQDQEREKVRKDGTQTTMEETAYADREEQERQWLYAMIDAAIEAEKARPAPPSSKEEGDREKNEGDQAGEGGKAEEAPKRKAKAPAPVPVTPEMLNALQDRHIEERGVFGTTRQQARDRQAFELNEQYGVFERGLRRDVAELEGTLQSSGRVRVWWLKLTRQVPWDTEKELANMRRSLENVEMRRREAVSALEIEQERRSKELEARQATERAALYGALERQQAEQAKLQQAAAEAARRSALVRHVGPSFDRAQAPSSTTAPQGAAGTATREFQRAAYVRADEPDSEWAAIQRARNPATGPQESPQPGSLTAEQQRAAFVQSGPTEQPGESAPRQGDIEQEPTMEQ